MNKITNPFWKCGWLVFIFLATNPVIGNGQDSVATRPRIVDNWMEYRGHVLHGGAKMIELKSVIPDLVYDLRYAGTNNFMKRMMYPPNTTFTFLGEPVANGLRAVQEELRASGMGLKIFDAYRPYSVTILFWELVKDERYVANPAKGSGHNKGIAVDLTIIDLQSGRELDMGTGFDNFTDSAHQTFTALPDSVLANRLLLRSVMEKNSFKALETEWWHYYWVGPGTFMVLDIDFKTLASRAVRAKANR